MGVSISRPKVHGDLMVAKEGWAWLALATENLGLPHRYVADENLQSSGLHDSHILLYDSHRISDVRAVQAVQRASFWWSSASNGKQSLEG
eukprot:4196370-Amphidinium_carterae.1